MNNLEFNEVMNYGFDNIQNRKNVDPDSKAIKVAMNSITDKSTAENIFMWASMSQEKNAQTLASKLVQQVTSMNIGINNMSNDIERARTM